MIGANPMERRLQRSAVFIILGLLVEALCLAWRGPLAFVIFSVLTGLLLFAGIASYLISLVSPRDHRTD